MSSPTAILTVTDLRVRFGGITALDGISFTVAPQTICGIIGPNGAGKTTLFNCVSRVYRPESGEITFEQRPLLPLPPHSIAAQGIARTFQNLALFERMSVLDNVLVGGHSRSGSHLWADLLNLQAAHRDDARLRARAMEWLEAVGIADVAGALVSTLPFGSRKRVELARALMSEPRLLLLDEPAAGLSVEEAQRFEQLVHDLRGRLALTVLLVEHRMGLVMSLCDHLVVLNFGRKIADGAPAAVSRDPAVVEAYLGTRAS